MAKKKGLLSLIGKMEKIMSLGDPGISFDLENEFRQTILAGADMDEELAELLPTLIPATPEDEARINIALDVLSWLLEELRVGMERGRSEAGERMERLQEALARHVFKGGGDAHLCAAVGNTLLESRVEILPVIHEANMKMMLSCTPGSDVPPPADIAACLVESLRELGSDDPFEALDHILEQTGLLDPRYQIAIAGEMLASDVVMFRDIAALMLFHPLADVRGAVAGMLSRAKGETVSPETLRNLIIVRNWFPAEIRAELDKAVANARRAKVECAPLRGVPVHSVHATTIDGAGAQSLWIAAGEKRRFLLCNILLKQGVGVIDTFIHRLPSAKAAERFMEGLPEMMCFAEVAPEYLDRAIDHALSAGIARGGAPHRGLLQIAMLIGKDQWKGEPFDAKKELALLGGQADSENRVDAADALERSAEWPGCEDFADTWFEDDDLVDRVVTAAMEEGGEGAEHRAVDAILTDVLEPRRGPWLERLVLMAVWLKSSRKPPVPWQQMYFVADAVASGRALREIPLMVSIAETTLAVAEERNGF